MLAVVCEMGWRCKGGLRKGEGYLDTEEGLDVHVESVFCFGYKVTGCIFVRCLLNLVFQSSDTSGYPAPWVRWTPADESPRKPSRGTSQCRTSVAQKAKAEDQSSSDWTAPELCSCQEMQLTSSGEACPQALHNSKSAPSIIWGSQGRVPSGEATRTTPLFGKQACTQHIQATGNKHSALQTAVHRR